jgi:hypothetical protein
LSKVLIGGDSELDSLVSSLQAQGMETLVLDDSQVSSLADSGDFSFDAGTDISVVGTSFLSASNASAVNLNGLLGAANVAVHFDTQGFGQVLSDGDAALDSLVAQLHAAGMDTLALDASQVSSLADSGAFSFDAGTDISVVGTSFLSASNASAVNLNGLLGAANVAVHFDTQGLGQVLSDGDAALDSLVAQLHAAGMDTLALDASQVSSLADSGAFSFDAGTDISVVGTSFLHAGSASDQHLDALFSNGSTNVNVNIGHQLMSDLAGNPSGATDFAARALDANVDTLTSGGATILDSLQASDLANALSGLSLGGSEQVVLQNAMALTTLSDADFTSLNNFLGSSDVTADLSLPGMQSDYASLGALSSAIDGLQHDLSVIGVDHIAITDDLANALANANIEFIQSAQKGGVGLDVTMLATNDNAGTAYLNSTLHDLQTVGVDEVTSDAGVQKIQVALRDAQENGPLFTLDDLPRFNVSNDVVVSLAVDEDDFAALLASDNGSASFEKLMSSGITEIDYTGSIADFEAHLDGSAALLSSGLALNMMTLNATEVQFLGLGDDTSNPLDLFHKG